MTFPVAPQPPTFALREPELCSGVPDVTVPVKYTSCELHTPLVVNCREVRRQALHPFKRAQRHLGQCVFVFWKLATSQPNNIEFVAMPELRIVIEQWRTRYCVSGATVEGAFGELDIAETFPKVQRSEVPQAVEQFYADACARAHAKAGELVFALHPGGLKHLDSLRKPRTRDAYICYSIADIFLCLQRAERNQRFLFVKNESIKFCYSGGFSNEPDVREASVLFSSTIFHVRSVSCRCLYLGFCPSCAARVTRVTCSKCSLLRVPVELE